jgi:hypothetical protein
MIQIKVGDGAFDDFWLSDLVPSLVSLLETFPEGTEITIQEPNNRPSVTYRRIADRCNATFFLSPYTFVCVKENPVKHRLHHAVCHCNDERLDIEWED